MVNGGVLGHGWAKFGVPAGEISRNQDILGAQFEMSFFFYPTKRSIPTFLVLFLGIDLFAGLFTYHDT